jgi:hypothetical protein
MVSATVPGKLGSSRPSHIAECSCQLRLRRLAERRHGYPTERANSRSHLFHIDVTAVAKLKMSLNLCCDVRIEYTLENGSGPSSPYGMFTACPLTRCLACLALVPATSECCCIAVAPG